MFAQFFGSYLLNNKAVSNEDLLEAISRLKKARIKLGTLAMHRGFMTAKEIDEVCMMQSREDKRFGEIAIARDYLTDSQVEELLKAQNPDYLLLGQILVDMNVLTNAQLEELFLKYQNETEIYDMDMESQANFDQLMKKFLLVSERQMPTELVDYLKLFFNNLLRFVGEDFMPMSPVPSSEFPVNYAVEQQISGDVKKKTFIDMSKETAVIFASRFAKMEFKEFDEYVKASIEDFLNLNNGLYGVNISNNYSKEIALNPPTVVNKDILELPKDSYVIPFAYPFGTIHLILCLLYTSPSPRDS